MSFQAMAWASEQTTGSATRKAVLYAIANHANKDGECFLRVETICQEAEVADRAARSAITDLKKAGLLLKTRKRREDGTLGVCHFTLTLHRHEMPDPPAADAATPPAADAAHEPGRPSEPVDLSAGKPPRARNVVWDTLVVALGWEPTTPSETSDFAKTVREIEKVVPDGSTPDQILHAVTARKRAFETEYLGATFTHRVLRNRWSELGQLAKVRSFAGSPLPELPDGEGF